jgi:hypothetical protein
MLRGYCHSDERKIGISVLAFWRAAWWCRDWAVGQLRYLVINTGALNVVSLWLVSADPLDV